MCITLTICEHIYTRNWDSAICTLVTRMLLGRLEKCNVVGHMIKANVSHCGNRLLQICLTQISGGMGRRPPITVGVRKLESLGYHMALFA